MSSDHAAFADWDGAYVLGALTPADRRAYEEHLDGCVRCRAAIGELASIPGLLARTTPPDDDETAGPPADLIDLVAARRDRRRRTILRRFTVGIGVAAVLVAGIAIAAPLEAATPPPTETVALAPVAGASLTASAQLTSVAWGTRIAMECGYPTASGYGTGSEASTYALVVTDKAGARSQVSTWTAVPGRTIRLEAATAVPLDQIAGLEVRAVPDGDAVLTAVLS